MSVREITQELITKFSGTVVYDEPSGDVDQIVIRFGTISDAMAFGRGFRVATGLETTTGGQISHDMIAVEVPSDINYSV